MASVSEHWIHIPSDTTLMYTQSPWQEMDLEANAKKHDVFGMLGCNEDKPYLASDPTWYGGKVHLRCKLTSGQKGSKQPFQITLEKPRIGPSTRFSRRFGSDNFIRVKIAQSLFYSSSKKDDLLEYFYRPFRFNDRVYRAFYAKDTTVFLVRTAEEWCRREEILKPSRNGLSFLDFLDWHNLRSENQHQVSLDSAFAVNFSNSVWHGVHGEVDRQICAWTIKLGPRYSNSAREYHSVAGHR